MERHSIHGREERHLRGMSQSPTPLYYIGDTSSLAKAAANHAATLKTSKYTDITDTNIFVQIAITSNGAWD